LLKYEFHEHFPDAQVFMDLDSIEPGLDFTEIIREAVDSCAVLLALIGPKWATLIDEQGHRRLDDPDDWVRFEIRAALELWLRVIPVLVDGGRPLRQEELPPELHKLARLNSLELSHSRYEYDAKRLLELVERVLAGLEVDRKDPTIIVRALASAILAADSITDRDSKAGALAEIAWALAATDPVRAERMAQTIADEGWKARALAEIARALAATDPGRADRLGAEAENIAQSIIFAFSKASLLADIANTLAATDPDRAEHIAQTIADEGPKARALAEVARALAATDPDRAERIAQSITNPSLRATTLVAIARATPDN